MNAIFIIWLLTFELTLILIRFSTFIDCHNIDTQFPIVFESEITRNNENYFGLSVEMQSFNDELNFLIGSPKTNSSLYNVRQSGTVFRCHLMSNDRTECREIFLDFRQIASSNRISQKKIDIKPTNDMFLGGTVVGRPESSQVVVCAHAWSQEFYRLVNTNELSEIIPTGSCYVIDLAKTHDTPIGIFPMTDRNLQFHFDTYYYSHSMTGFSAAFTSRGENLLLGSPGFYQWRGSFIETNDLNTKTNEVIGEQFIVQKSRLSSDTESYAGYSIASGYFLGGIKNSVAVGAPRDNLRGRVYIYNLRNGYHTEDTTSMFTHINGLQIGEYFGATLLSININNDEFSDLVIGSPMYSTRELSDCGRVFVYLSNGKGFNKPVVLSPSESSGSRFGTSLADLGDINYDGYNDLAVGAPYEDQNGVIYLYLGSRNGIHRKYAQRISAKQHFNHLNLKGFGISISGNKDVDKNYYNDILVGSYLSNNAVLLRTKPVVTIETEILFNSSHINVNDQNCRYVEPYTRIQRRSSCVGIRYCLRYDGSYVPSSLYFNITIEMDDKRPENPRCFAIIKNEMKSRITKVQEISAYKTKTCSDQFIVYLKDKTSLDDIFNPIDFSLSHSITQLQSPLSFCPNCPIISNNQKTTNQLHFQTGCRIDAKCVSNIKLSTKSLLNGIISGTSDQLLQGFHKNLTIIASVINTGEPSYLTKIVISSSLKLNLLKQDTRCRLPVHRQQNDTELALIECDVGNPLRTGSHEEVFVPLDVSQLDSNVDRLDLTIEVMTASEVTKDSHLTESFEIKVIRSASLEIFGSSVRSEIVYEIEDKRKTNLIPFTGIFQITKQNWSSVENVMIEIVIPSHFNRKPLLYRPVVTTGRNALNREPSFNCNRTIETLPVLPIKSSDNPRFKRETEENEYKMKGKTLKLDCKPPINCQTMQCFAGPFGSDRQSVKFSINSSLDIKTIESIFGKKYDSIDLIIKTKATILDQNIVSKPAIISTKFSFKRLILKKEWFDLDWINWIWIFVVSAVVGLILLIAIAFVLWKLGFFSRNTYATNEDQNELKSNDENKERNSLMEFNPENDIGDND